MTQADIIVNLVAWAVTLTGYAMPAEMPVIHYRDHAHFIEMVCDGVDTKQSPCANRAYYNDEKDAIIVLNTKYWEINKEWTEYQQSIILHEIVHYLQDMTGKYVDWAEWHGEKHCRLRDFRQREAYMIQDKYVYIVHGYRRTLPRYFDGCGN